jgi:hypothetical protein
MATRTELYPSRWLGAADCETPIVATVDHCTIETVGQGVRAERKPVLYFTSATKPLIVNKTNYDAIASITGNEDTNDWRGAVLELYAVDVNGPNGPTRGVRVRKARKAAKAAAARVPDDLDAALLTVGEREY